MEGFKAWQRALGNDVDAKGPWDPAKWGGIGLEHVPRVARPVGLVAVGDGARLAEIFVASGPPPSDLRVRWVSEVPGKDALNAWFAGVHPMELQRVLPPLAAGEDVLLAAQPASPLMPGGRPASVLQSRVDGHRWRLTGESADRPAGAVAEGERVHLVQLARLYADTQLGSIGPREPAWVPVVRAAREALLAEDASPFSAVKAH